MEALSYRFPPGSAAVDRSLPLPLPLPLPSICLYIASAASFAALKISRCHRCLRFRCLPLSCHWGKALWQNSFANLENNELRESLATEAFRTAILFLVACYATL